MRGLEQRTLLKRIKVPTASGFSWKSGLYYVLVLAKKYNNNKNNYKRRAHLLARLSCLLALTGGRAWFCRKQSSATNVNRVRMDRKM